MPDAPPRQSRRDISPRRHDGLRRALEEAITTRRRLTRVGRGRDSAPSGKGEGARGSSGWPQDRAAWRSGVGGLHTARITMWIERMSRSPTPSHSIDHEVRQLHHGQYFRACKRELQAAFRAHANAPPLEAMERIENPQSAGPTRSLPHISLFPFTMSGFLTCNGHPILGLETLSLHFC